MDSLTIPQDQNVYVASVTEMENTIIKNQLQEAFMVRCLFKLDIVMVLIQP